MKAANALGFTAGTAGNDADAQRERMMNALKGTFRPEFLNRIDDIVIFNRLTEENIRAIADLMLGDVQKRIRELGIEIVFDPSVSALLSREGFDEHYGARPLRRAVVRLVEDAFSTELLEGRISTGEKVTAIVRDGVIAFEKQSDEPAKTE